MDTANNDDSVKQEIEIRAFLRYCDRGRGADGALDDWLAAEREIMMSRSGGAEQKAAPTPKRKSAQRASGQTQRGRR